MDPNPIDLAVGKMIGSTGIENVSTATATATATATTHDPRPTDA